jgi:hypothetical protein
MKKTWLEIQINKPIARNIKIIAGILVTVGSLAYLIDLGKFIHSSPSPKKYASHITFQFVDSTLHPISGIKINSPQNIKKIDEFSFVLDTNLTMTIQPLEIINPRNNGIEGYGLNIASDSIQEKSIQIK